MRLSYWQLSTLVLLAAFPLLAQQGNSISVPKTVVLCETPAGPVVIGGSHNHYIKPAAIPTKDANVTVEFVAAGEKMGQRTCTAYPEEAKTAFRYAAAQWSNVLQNEHTLRIRTCYADLRDNQLGIATAPVYEQRGARALGEDALYYPQAIYETLEGINAPRPDMEIVINDETLFYYGTDWFDNEANRLLYDFVTLVLHEIGHGLGFFGTARYAENFSTIGLQAGLVEGFQVRIPTIFDRAVTLGNDPEMPVVDVPNNSAELDDALLGRDGGLFFDQSQIERYAPGSDRFRLYTPATYQQGSSFGHFDDQTELMHHAIVRGQYQRDLTQTAAVLQTLGWAGEVQVAAPVTLTHFTGTLRDEDVDLTWNTATETENEGFTIEYSTDGLTFTDVGYQAGQGTTTQSHDYAFTHPAPGTGLHYYRLRQTDFDGSENLSELVAVTVTDGSTTVLEGPFPNPSNGSEVNLHYHSAQSGSLTLRVWSSAGQLVYEQPRAVTAGRNVLTFGLHQLTSGVYLLQVVDGSGLHTRSLRIQ